jgi:hypothetical protein
VIDDKTAGPRERESMEILAAIVGAAHPGGVPGAR